MNRYIAAALVGATATASLMAAAWPADAASRPWPHKPPTFTRPAPYLPCSVDTPKWRGKCVIVPARKAPTFPKAVAR